MPRFWLISDLRPRFDTLASFDSNNIAAKMFKYLSNCDLAMVALCSEEKDEGNQNYFMKNSGKRRFWMHAAWKSLEKKFSTFTSSVGRRHQISSIFQNVDDGVEPVGT
ncbi:hypothetical protein JTB14_015604 [Gonioctena quinquepunctata]|nr:hypothetical protein JTB14_015604 [Gonioctena quinquepunctata]